MFIVHVVLEPTARDQPDGRQTITVGDVHLRLGTPETAHDACVMAAAYCHLRYPQHPHPRIVYCTREGATT